MTVARLFQSGLGGNPPAFNFDSSISLLRKRDSGVGPVVKGEYEGRRRNQLDLQRNATGPSKPETAPPVVQEILHTPGQPLDERTQASMETHFGHDFSGVRVHTDSRAAESAQALGARAYTVGEHIVFDAGQFEPTTVKGKALLAHELTHVTQQRERSRVAEHSIQKWSVSEHEKLTRIHAQHLLKAEPGFELDEGALAALAKYSGDMDRKAPELWFNVGSIGRKIPLIGAIFGRPGQSISEYYARHPENALNHGEGGLYAVAEPSAARKNMAWQARYEVAARTVFSRTPSRFSSIEESRLVKPPARRRVLSILGDALHIAQDRGAHREGARGLGHDDPHVSPDNPGSNSHGYGQAVSNTKGVLSRARDILITLLDRKYGSSDTAVFPSEVTLIQPNRWTTQSSRSQDEPPQPMPGVAGRLEVAPAGTAAELEAEAVSQRIVMEQALELRRTAGQS